MSSILAGWCSLTYEQVNYSHVDYLLQVWEGVCMRMQIEERRMYEVSRLENFFVANTYAKKPKKNPQELYKFPWEKPAKKTVDVSRLKEYGKQTNDKPKP